MKYVIYSYSKGQLARQDSSLGRLFESKISRLARYLSNYIDTPKLEIRIYYAADRVKLSYMINMRSKPVYIYGEGENVLDLAKELFNKFEILVAKQQQIERKQFLKSRKRWQEEGFKEHLNSLNNFKEQDDKAPFVHLLQSLMPDIQAHIKKQIRHELVKRELPSSTIDYQDLLSEFYLRVFESFDKRPTDKEKFVEWLYDEANTLLKEKMAVIANKAAPGFIPYEDLVRAKAREMEEQFTVDAEGELVMLDELDDFLSPDEFGDIMDESADIERLSEK
jgi:hypothetical protein